MRHDYVRFQVKQNCPNLFGQFLGKNLNLLIIKVTKTTYNKISPVTFMTYCMIASHFIKENSDSFLPERLFTVFTLFKN